MGSPGFGASVLAALRPAPDPVSISVALRALLASGLIVAAGTIFGDLQSTGMAFFGAACAVSLARTGVYRARLRTMAAQALGAVIGITAGALLPSSAASLVLTAAVAGAVSGWLGGIGPSAPAFGMMLSVGVGFGQFGGSTLTWWRQDLWYLVGTALVGVTILLPWLIRHGVQERVAAADLLSAAADLCAAAGSDSAPAARVRLAAASATARAAGSFPVAELTALAAVTCYTDQRPVASEVVAAIRTAGEQMRSGQPIAVTIDTRDADTTLQALADALSPAPQRLPAPTGQELWAVLRSLGTRPALENAARMCLCMSVATAITAALDRPAHGFWLPMTVAAIVRPEFASVFVRTVNRVVGTLLGAAIAALLLELRPSSAVVAAATALALSLALVGAPKLYAFYVIGGTAAALLAASLGRDEPILAGVRLIDTLVGAAVAVVFGYALWPGARRFPGARLDAAVAAIDAYLEEATKPGERRERWQSRRDDAYRAAHQVRAASEAAVAEPPPVNHRALEVIPLAVELEDIVDAVTTAAYALDSGVDVSEPVREIRRRLAAVAPSSARR